MGGHHGRHNESALESLTGPAHIPVPAPGEDPSAAHAASQRTTRQTHPGSGSVEAIQPRRAGPNVAAAAVTGQTHRAQAMTRQGPAGRRPSLAADGTGGTASSNPAQRRYGDEPATPTQTPAAAAPPPAAPQPIPQRTATPRKAEPPPPGEDVSSVRPFVVTRGRTQASTDTRLESILEVANQQWLAEKGKSLSPEELAIVRQIASTYLTVAEVSAHLKLPVGVVKVLVSDLAESGVLLVHDTVAGAGGGINAGGAVTREQTLELLESVLNAISEL
jgi:hypothetical protein